MRERFKSGERDRDKMREGERGREHQREGDRERCRDKLQESSLEKERHSVPKDKRDRERDKKHKRHEIKQIDTQNNLKLFEGRDKEHHRRRESRHHLGKLLWVAAVLGIIWYLDGNSLETISCL